MDLTLIEMPKEEALRHFERYRTLVKRGKRRALAEEDAALLAGYEALSEGKALVNINDAMRMAGLDDKGRPRLAIVRADATWVWFSSESRWQPPDGYVREARFGMDSGSAQTAAKERMRAVRLRVEGWEAEQLSKQNWRAMVPIIPPPIRPPVSKLHQFHVLWEAAWQRAVPKDPALICRVTGSIYAVLATWELTALEQTVLGLVRNGS